SGYNPSPQGILLGIVPGKASTIDVAYIQKLVQSMANPVTAVIGAGGDAQRALVLLEEYRTKLSNTEDRQLRNSIQRVIDIFQSNLFQALIGTVSTGSLSFLL
ncbi:hypothetical protein NFI96_012879, partial [Prochilodus magdalenae]